MQPRRRADRARGGSGENECHDGGEEDQACGAHLFCFRHWHGPCCPSNEGCDGRRGRCYLVPLFLVVACFFADAVFFFVAGFFAGFFAALFAGAVTATVRVTATPAVPLVERGVSVRTMFDVDAERRNA